MIMKKFCVKYLKMTIVSSRKEKEVIIGYQESNFKYHIRIVWYCWCSAVPEPIPAKQHILEYLLFR